LARKHLIEQVVSVDTHLRTGFLGTPLLLEELQKAGRSDLSYTILFNQSYPSWLYSVNNGATTTWERWNSYSLEEGFNPQGMNSLNHYAYGSVYRWFHEGILGIRPTSPGFNTFNIAPQIGTQLSTASGQYNTPQGLIQVAWERADNSLSITLTVPANSEASLVVPNGYKADPNTNYSSLGAGNYHFTFLPEKV
jgi:alpha-L-rhamnosidase